MRKLFVTRQDDSFFNVADIFGYVIVFFVIWIFLFVYRTVSKVTSKASTIATIQLETVKNALPLNSGKEVNKEVSEDKSTEVKREEPVASLIPAISGKALEFVSTTGTKLLTKEGAKDTLNSINSYLNGVIYTTSDEVKNIKEEVAVNREAKKKAIEVEKKDELSEF